MLVQLKISVINVHIITITMLHGIPIRYVNSSYLTKQNVCRYFRFTLGDTGQHKSGKNLVEAVDDCLENIDVGKFVAVHLANYDKMPVIGEVLEVNGDNITIHCWKGSFKGKGSPQDVPQKVDSMG